MFSDILRGVDCFVSVCACVCLCECLSVPCQDGRAEGFLRESKWLSDHHSVGQLFSSLLVPIFMTLVRKS